jgi:DNA polymerase-4
MAIVDRVARRLRAAKRVCRTVVLRLRFDDFTRATRSYTMVDATADTHTILKTANALMKASMPLVERRGLTLVGISLTNLANAGAVQLSLPFNRSHDLDATLDLIRDRFGTAALTRGVHVGTDPGVTMPMLAD